LRHEGLEGMPGALVRSIAVATAIVVALPPGKSVLYHGYLFRILEGQGASAVNQDGIVFQKDLGPDTANIAAATKLFDPDLSWTRVDIVN
jgi:hypothetical protein